MCWRKERLFPKKIENLKAIIANKDIIVYKIGYKCRDNFISLYMTYEYIPGELAEHITIVLEEVKSESLIDDYRDYYIIDRGYHSYGKNIKVNIVKIFYNVTFFIYNDYFCINRFSCTYHDLFLKKLVIGKFIIPEGTKYFINDNDEYVSEYIRFDKIMLEYKCSIYNINFNKLCVG